MSGYIAVLGDIMEVSKLSPEFMPYVDIKANLQPTKHGACQLKLPQNTAIPLVMLPMPLQREFNRDNRTQTCIKEGHCPKINSGEKL